MNGVNKGFTKHLKDGIVYYTVPAFEPYVSYIFCGDTSNSLSFKAVRGITDGQMQKSFQRLCSTAGLPYPACTMTNIVHGTEITYVDESNMGSGVCSLEKLPSCDGLYTDKENIPIATTHADCMPIAFYDKAHNAGCVLHAGWRGILADIQGKAVSLFKSKYNAAAEDLLFAIGPAINACCFEVGNDVAEDFEKAFGKKYILNGEKKRIDLLKIVIDELTGLGIPACNITYDGRCTLCGGELASYRRDGEKAGTMVQIMCLN